MAHITTLEALNCSQAAEVLFPRTLVVRVTGTVSSKVVVRTTCCTLVWDDLGERIHGSGDIFARVFKLGVSFATHGTKNTKACQIIGTRFLLNMAIATVRTVPTKPFRIPRAIFDTILRSDVKEQTFRVGTISIFLEKVTRRHFAQIIDMKKLTVVILLT